MKTIIQSPQEALASQLQVLYYIESKLSDKLRHCLDHITSDKIRSAIDKYVSNAESKLQNLKRIFNYLMYEPLIRKSEVVMKMISETYEMLTYKSSPHLKDMLIVSCFQNINSYKIAAYRTAYLFAEEIKVDSVTDLLQQILESELEIETELAPLAIKEFNEMESAI